MNKYKSMNFKKEENQTINLSIIYYNRTAHINTQPDIKPFSTCVINTFPSETLSSLCTLFLHLPLIIRIICPSGYMSVLWLYISHVSIGQQKTFGVCSPFHKKILRLVFIVKKKNLSFCSFSETIS